MTAPIRKQKKTLANVYVGLYPADVEMVRWGAEFLGCSKAEFHRSAIRAFTMSLQNLKGER